MNFTNLGGIGGQICFLKNVNGMWLLQQCIEELGLSTDESTLGELLRACEAEKPPPCAVDVDNAELMVPGGMLEKLKAQLACRSARQIDSETRSAPKVANLILHSLAERYAEVLADVAEITGKKLKRLFIVGGGSRNKLLNRLTAERTGLEVIAGSTESTTIGNFALQMAALDQGESAGVSAETVARWSERLLARDLAVSAARQSGEGI